MLSATGSGYKMAVPKFVALVVLTLALSAQAACSRGGAIPKNKAVPPPQYPIQEAVVKNFTGLYVAMIWLQLQVAILFVGISPMIINNIKILQGRRLPHTRRSFSKFWTHQLFGNK